MYRVGLKRLHRQERNLRTRLHRFWIHTTQRNILAIYQIVFRLEAKQSEGKRFPFCTSIRLTGMNQSSQLIPQVAHLAFSLRLIRTLPIHGREGGDSVALNPTFGQFFTCDSRYPLRSDCFFQVLQWPRWAACLTPHIPTSPKFVLYPSNRRATEVVNWSSNFQMVMAIWD